MRHRSICIIRSVRINPSLSEKHGGEVMDIYLTFLDGKHTILLCFVCLHLSVHIESCDVVHLTIFFKAVSLTSHEFFSVNEATLIKDNKLQ